MTGVNPLEGSVNNFIQESTEIKVVQNEHPEGYVEDVFQSKMRGPSTANPEISQIYGMDGTTA